MVFKLPTKHLLHSQQNKLALSAVFSCRTRCYASDLQMNTCAYYKCQCKPLFVCVPPCIGYLLHPGMGQHNDFIMYLWVWHIPYGEKFSRDKIFAVFVVLPQTAKILTAKISLTTQTTPFSCNRCGLLSMLLRVYQVFVRWQCTVILVAWTSYQNYQILRAPSLRKYRRSSLFWLMREWRVCWRVCWRR